MSGDADHLLERARAQRSVKAFDDSYESVQGALTLRPGWLPALWLELSLVGDRSGSLDEFRRLADAFGPLEDLTAGDLTRLTVLSVRSGDWSKALEAGSRLLEVGERERGLWASATARWEIGDEADALALIEEHVRRADIPAMLGAARFFLHIDDPGRAAAALPPGPVNPRLLVSIARALINHDRSRQALDLVGRALEQDPDHAVALGVRRRALGAMRVATPETWMRRRPAADAIVPTLGRVLHLLPRSMPYHQSGGTLRTHYLAKAQKQAGLDPHLATRLGFPWDMGIEDAAPCEIVDGLPYYRLRDARGLGRIDQHVRNVDLAEALVRQLRPAVLHPTSNHLNGLLAFELRRRFRLPVVYEVRGFPTEPMARGLRSRVLSENWVARKRLEEQCWRDADRVVTLAEVMKAHIVSRGVPAEKVVVVPNAVEAAAFAPGPGDHRLRAELRIPRADTVVGYVSTLNAYEGVVFLIDAVARLSREDRPVSALIVGDGPELERLRQRARELGIEDRVHLVGRVPHDEITRYYSLIDLFVVPRLDQPPCQLVTPLKPYEAMASGCPLVVSRLPALQEMIIEGETGVSFRPEDAESLAEVLRTLLDDPERRETLARNALEWVRTNRSWSSNAERYIELYAELGAAE